MTNIQQLYELLRQSKFPVLGKEVGDFALFDSLIAGCADRLCQGGSVKVSEVAEPDVETSQQIKHLRLKQFLSADEQSFIERFDLLDQLRSAILKESVKSV